jgi:two-component system, cell cycle response regulator
MKVLVVDREELSTRILAKKLENWGYTPYTAHNVYEAERILEREFIHLVITEIDLPDKSGKELVSFVRAMRRPRYVYIIILTGITETTLLLETLGSGADDLLRKPLNVFEMRLRIKAAKRMLNLEDELREGAGTDGTTGLVNLNSFSQFFRFIIAGNGRMNTQGALMFFHVENYWAVREEHGYKASEHMMRALSTMCDQAVRAADLVTRLDDSTFGLCLQNTVWPTCRIVGENIETRANSAALVYEGADLQPRLRIETANFPNGDMSHEDILNHAPRFPFHGGEAVSPSDVPVIASAAKFGSEPKPVKLSGGDSSNAILDLLRRAGIDVESYERLLEFEQSQVLKLARQLASTEGATPAV